MTFNSSKTSSNTATQMRLENTFLCEDIRWDSNGKPIVTGILPRTLYDRDPSHLFSSLWLFGEMFLLKSPTTLKFRIQKKGSERVISETQALFTPQPNTWVYFRVNFLSITLSEHGTYEILWKEEEGNSSWKSVKTLNYTHPPASVPTNMGLTDLRKFQEMLSQQIAQLEINSQKGK